MMRENLKEASAKCREWPNCVVHRMYARLVTTTFTAFMAVKYVQERWCWLSFRDDISRLLFRLLFRRNFYLKNAWTRSVFQRNIGHSVKPTKVVFILLYVFVKHICALHIWVGEGNLQSERLQIFYGRCTSRRNLFDEEDGVEGSSGVLTRSSSCATLQKNRSGRSVHTNCVYMAHALLNVHNMEPLSPCKAPKQSPFKLHRLVRPASKSDRRRLSKLRFAFSCILSSRTS